MKDTMERAKLESELDIQRLVDRIPPDILAELKRQQRHTERKGDRYKQKTFHAAIFLRPGQGRSYKRTARSILYVGTTV